MQSIRPNRITHTASLAIALAFSAERAAAQPVNDLCSGAIQIQCGDTFLVDTTLAGLDLSVSCGGSDSAIGGVWYTFIGTGDFIELSPCNPGTTTLAWLRLFHAPCQQLDCLGSSTPPSCTGGFGVPLRFWSGAGLEYRILVRGVWTAVATFEISVTCTPPVPEDCGNGVDDDLDGHVDCFDDNCGSQLPCLEDCGNNLDDDLDGWTDCADVECHCTSSCPMPIPGDECCTALPAITGSNSFDNSAMTTGGDDFDDNFAPGEPVGSIANDIWFEWTASLGGICRWNTCDPVSFDADVAVYASAGDCADKVQIGSGTTSGEIGCQVFSSVGQFPISAGSSYLFRIGSFGPGGAGPGTLTIFETCALPVANLAATVDCITGAIALSWTPAGFDGYEVRRDGIVISPQLPAGSGGYVDLGSGAGTRRYEVVGICAGMSGAVSAIEVIGAASAGTTDLIVRGEGPGGFTDSVSALSAELTALGRSVFIMNGGLADYPCGTDEFEIIWNLNGTYPHARSFTLADGAALLAAHTAGVGIYTESGIEWGSASIPTDFDSFDGVSGSGLGTGFLRMDGADSSLGLDLTSSQDVPYLHDTPGYAETTSFVVAASDPGLAGAAAIWTRDDILGIPYVAGVFGQGLPGRGNVVSQPWEFGGFDGDRTDLAIRYVLALGGSIGVPIFTFLRGDLDGDGSLGIADPIALLDALFPTGGTANHPIDCDDALDANDDGRIDLADPIRLLGSIFLTGGGPLPPWPLCGDDPSPDSLTCANHPVCP